MGASVIVQCTFGRCLKWLAQQGTYNNITDDNLAQKINRDLD